MLTLQSIKEYSGPALSRGDTFLYLPAHPLLSPHIANYTVTFPMAGQMPANYTVLPTASSTILYSYDGHNIHAGLRGVNSVASVVGGHTQNIKLMLLIEFHPGGLFPLLSVPQNQLLNQSFSMNDLDKSLHRRIQRSFETASTIQSLVQMLNQLFLSAFASKDDSSPIRHLMAHIHQRHGNITAKELSATTHYSERQLQRLFLSQIGTGVKTFSRIVRLNHSLRLLQTANGNFANTAAAAGYFDQPHFIKDFQLLCGTTPKQYLANMSVFYNDTSKM